MKRLDGVQRIHAELVGEMRGTEFQKKLLSQSRLCHLEHETCQSLESGRPPLVASSSSDCDQRKQFRAMAAACWRVGGIMRLRNFCQKHDGTQHMQSYVLHSVAGCW